MKIETLKDFEKLVKLCRKLGIDAMKVDGMEFQIKPLPKRQPKPYQPTDPLEAAKIIVPQYDEKLPTPENKIQEAADKIATDGLTEEQLLMWSVKDEAQDEQ